VRAVRALHECEPARLEINEALGRGPCAVDDAENLTHTVRFSSSLEILLFSFLQSGNMDTGRHLGRYSGSRIQFVAHAMGATADAAIRSRHCVLCSAILLLSSLGEYSLSSLEYQYRSVCSKILSHNVYIVVVAMILFVCALGATGVAVRVVFLCS
jgi:hypothetical protein